MNILETNPDKLHVLFLRFGSYILSLNAVFPSGIPYIFSDMYLPYHYTIANTPILQSRYPPVSRNE